MSKMYRKKRATNAKRDCFELEFHANEFDDARRDNCFDTFFVRETNLDRYRDLRYFEFSPLRRLAKFPAPKFPPAYYPDYSFQPRMPNYRNNTATEGSRPWQESHHRSHPRKLPLNDVYFANHDKELYGGSRSEGKTSRYAYTRAPVRIDVKRHNTVYKLDKNSSKEKCASGQKCDNKLNDKYEIKTAAKGNSKNKATTRDLSSDRTRFRPSKEEETTSKPRVVKETLKRRSSYQGEPRTKHRKVSSEDRKSKHLSDNDKKKVHNGDKPKCSIIEASKDNPEYDIIEELERTINTLSKGDKDLVQEGNLTTSNHQEFKKDIKMKLIHTSPSNKEPKKCTSNGNSTPDPDKDRTKSKTNTKNKFPLYVDQQSNKDATDKPILEEIFVLEDALKDIDRDVGDPDKQQPSSAIEPDRTTGVIAEPIKVESSDGADASGSNSPTSNEVAKSLQFGDFVNLDTRMTYLYSFKQYFDDNRTVDMDISDTSSPSRTLFESTTLSEGGGTCEEDTTIEDVNKSSEMNVNDSDGKSISSVNINKELLKIFGEECATGEVNKNNDSGGRHRSQSFCCSIPGKTAIELLRKIRSLNDISTATNLDTNKNSAASSNVVDYKDELLSLLSSDCDHEDASLKPVAPEPTQKALIVVANNDKVDTKKKRARSLDNYDDDSSSSKDVKKKSKKKSAGDKTTSSNPDNRLKHTSKEKYVTKAQYMKTFATNKSAAPVTLSIETAPSPSNVKQRRATFTCEADNETILKKVDKQRTRQTFLELFGPSSDDDEELGKLQNSRPKKKPKEQRRRRSRSKSKESKPSCRKESKRQSTESITSKKDNKIRNNSRDSETDKAITKSDSEPSLIIDESSLLMNRASESDVDIPSSEGCRPYVITKPQLRKIRAMETVQDECTDTVYISESPDVRNDCLTVHQQQQQQQQQTCPKEDDDVVEVIPPMPMVDLTEEDETGSPQEAFPNIIVEPKKEIDDVVQGTITLYRAEEDCNDQVDVQAVSVSVSLPLDDSRVNISPHAATGDPNCAKIVDLSCPRRPNVSVTAGRSITNQQDLIASAIENAPPSVASTNQTSVQSCQPPNLVTSSANEERVVDLTNENYELSSMDLKLIVEILTRHVYFLAHLCSAQKAYVEVLKEKRFYNYYFKAEISLFEQEKRSRLYRQSSRLWSELQFLGVRANKHLSELASLIVEHVTVNLRNKDMPKSVTKSIVYLLLGELMKPKEEMFSCAPLFKTLIRHCDIVTSRMQTRSAGLFTDEMRRTLAIQIREYIRMFSTGGLNMDANTSENAADATLINLLKRPPSATDNQIVANAVAMNPPPSRQQSAVRRPPNQNQHVFARPKIPNSARQPSVVGPPNNQIADLPGGANTNTLGRTPRYLPSYETAIRSSHVYASPSIQRPPPDTMFRHLTGTRTPPSFAQTNNIQPGRAESSSQLMQPPFGDSRRQSENLLDELLTPTINQALFGQSKSPVNDNFRIKLPFTVPITTCATTVTTTTAGTTISPSPTRLQSPPVPTSISTQSVLTLSNTQEQQILVNNTAINDKYVVGEPPTTKVLNQGLQALSSIGQPSAMLNSSSSWTATKEADSLPSKQNKNKKVKLKGKGRVTPSKPQPKKRGRKPKKRTNNVETFEISSDEDAKSESNNCDAPATPQEASEPAGPKEATAEGNVEDLETIDLTWIDDMDDQELQSEMDFVFVKQEIVESEAGEEPNGRVVPSPADSGIASPPIQSEEETIYTVVRNLCICGQIAHYNCACGDAWYCGQQCQLIDWESHQTMHITNSVTADDAALNKT